MIYQILLRVGYGGENGKEREGGGRGEYGRGGKGRRREWR
jgi:hypothetical protein